MNTIHDHLTMFEEQTMNKQIAIALYESALQCARDFSNPDREKNVSHETFELKKIYIRSETIAEVVYLKNSGKHGVAVFIYIKNTWSWFFPKDSHYLGLSKIGAIKEEIENKNYPLNFEGGFA